MIKWCFLSVLVVLASCVTIESRQSGPYSRDDGAPSIEGTYQLVQRRLPDGTTKRPPEVMGVLTYTKDHRNFNVLWKDAGGRLFTYSVVSKYTLSEDEYSEQITFSTTHDQIGGNPVEHAMSLPRRSVPVTTEGGRIQFDLPFDPVVVTFERRRMTATSPEFVDTWERID